MARAIANLLMDSSTPTPLGDPLSDTFGSGLSGNFGSGLFGSLAPSAPPEKSVNALASAFASAPPIFLSASPLTQAFGSSLANIIAPPVPPALYVPPPKPEPVAPETKRKAFFSFQYDDIMRVNNVRNAWKITHPSPLNRSFYDSSLWETWKITDPEVIKRIIQSGVFQTSAVCVQVGSGTWSRRWVRYEIARAIVDGRGLLAVHINSINHYQRKGPHPWGQNPLAHMGIAKLRPDRRVSPQYYLHEMTLVADGNGGVTEQWTRYSDFTAPVKKPN
jgi:MTH538 TIR-like domain (DUF1863)